LLTDDRLPFGFNRDKVGVLLKSDGAWYFYPSPIYPYPDPYEPPVSLAAAPSTVPPAAPLPRSCYYSEAENQTCGMGS
jgi:hypothetical protein